MNFQTPSGQHDEVSKVYDAFFQDADTGFIGVDERTPVYQLASGWVASAKNKRFRAGRATDRGGIQLCRWMKGDGTVPFTQIYGGVVYSDPTATTEWILIAADGGVWKTRPGNVATPVPLPAGVVLSADSFGMFVQCMNVVVLLRGPDLPPLSMSVLDTGFEFIQQTQAGIEAGLSPIPNSSFGAYLLNRLDLVQGKDFVAASNIGDYTSYQAVTETFQINQGDSDQLVGFYMMNNATIVCLKTRSTYNILNAFGDLATNATGPFVLTREYGCIAPLTAVTFGANLYWLGQPGLVSVAVTALNQQQATTSTLSWSLPVTFGRINGLYVSASCSAIWDSKLFLAAPLDDGVFKGVAQTAAQAGLGDNAVYTLTVGQAYYWEPDQTGETLSDGTTTLYGEGVITPVQATVTVTGVTGAYEGDLFAAIVGANTGVLVYDFMNNAWCGSDEAQGVVCPTQFLRLNVNGKERLLALCADGWIRMWEEGFEDEIVAPAPNYFDLLVNGIPTPGTMVQIGEQVLTVTNSATNTADSWGCSTQAIALANLWSDGTYGFDPALAAAWAQIGLVPAQIAGGVRFDGVNGVTPGIAVNGSTASGNQGAFFIDYFGAGSLTLEPSASVVLSAPANTFRTFQVNNGIVLTVPNVSTNSAPASWGKTAANLWSGNSLGYNPALASPWPAAAVATQISNGVKFTAYNGVQPVVYIDGTARTGVYNEFTVTDSGGTVFDMGSATCIQVTPIQSQFLSRAFSCLDKDGKRYVGLFTIAATWDPSYVIATAVNGAYQTAQYLPADGSAGITKDRTQYDVQDKPAYDVSNVNNDFAAPKRFDYSVGLDDLSPGQAAMHLQGGVNLDQAQDTIERIDVDERGYWMQVQFNNNTGSHEVKMILMEILRGDRVAGGNV